MEKIVFWQHLEHSGSEHLKIREDETTITAQGVVQDIHHITYRITMDKNWLTRRVDVQEDENHSYSLYSDGKGNWSSEGQALTKLKGAIDMDLSVTPFSNTLPINRFHWEEGQERELEMAYVEVPGCKLKKLKQHYTYLGNNGEKRRFQYRCRNYGTVITVDQDGIVSEYPGVFTRRS